MRGKPARGVVFFLARGGASLLSGLWDAVFPPRCPLCRETIRAGGLLCDDCLSGFQALEEPLCRVCANPFSENNAAQDLLCPVCRTEPRFFERGAAFGLYQGTLAEALRLFKFQGRRELAAPLSGLCAQAAGKWFGEEKIDLVVPVPLHKNRLKQRGFNQAADLARAAAGQLRASLSFSALFRVKDTSPHYGLTFEQRKRNVKAAFKPGKPGLVKGRRILLIDDIMTTAATMNECARVLKKAGAESVFALALARTEFRPPYRDPEDFTREKQKAMKY